MIKDLYVKLLAVFALFLLPGLVAAQTTTSIYASGTTGSYNTGSVDVTGGIKLDGNLDSISIGNPSPYATAFRGWAKFDLSSIPAGATITAVTVYFTTYNGTTSSGALNTISIFTGLPDTMSGLNLYNTIGAGTVVNSASWTANGLQTQPLNSSGVTFIQNNIGGYADLGFMRVGYLPYYIYGYPATQADQPRLDVTYTVSTACNTISSVNITGPSTICTGASFTLSSATNPAASGYNFQWESSPANAGTWSPVSAATNSTFTTTQSAATDYRLVVTCPATSSSVTSNTVAVAQSNFNTCYCPGTVSYVLNDDITNVSIGSINNGTACASLVGSQGTAVGGADIYSDFTASTVPVPGLMQGISQTLNVTMNSCGGGNTIRECKAYIDYNQNGLFTDPGEEIIVYPSANPNSATYTASVNFTVPATATLGNTRMRIILSQGSGAIASPCSVLNSYGEIEDYTVNITAFANCTGAPVAGTASGPSSVCPNAAFGLSVAGYTVAGAISIQWESSPAGVGVWSLIPGATTPSYTVTSGITTATDYHAVITCTNGGGTDVSNIVAVGMSPAIGCYCIPTTVNGCNSGDHILSVAFAGINNSSGACISGGSYSNYQTTVPAPTVYNGISYPITVHVNYGGTEYAALWIDYDQSGTFDASEFTLLTASNTGTPDWQFDAVIMIPATALNGQTGMRVRSSYNSTPAANSACSNTYSYGETEDYIIDIQTPPNCTSPVAGTISSAVSNVCPTQTFTVTSSGFTNNAAGITFQWESSPAAVGNWTLIPGATTSILTVTNQTTPTDYHLVVTCSFGGATDISNILSIGMNPFYNCYCKSQPLYPYDGEISNVTMGSLNNSSTCSQTGTGSSLLNQYSDYTSLTPLQLNQAVPYPLSVTAGSCGGSYDAWVKVFIDFDQNGSFTDPGEEVYSGQPPGGLYTPAGVAATGIVNIPVTATLGITGMRVILWQTNSGSTVVPCQNGAPYYYGETEDYLVEILPATTCSGQPNATTISLSGGGTGVCSNQSFTLVASGMSTGIGISYDWQYFDGTNWVPTGATSINYTVTAGITAPTSYRFITTCSNGGAQDISNTLALTINAPMTCYCVPTTGGGSTYYISGFTTTGAATNLNISSSTGTVSGYKDLTAQPALVVVPGTSFNFSMNVAGGSTYGAAVWIDTSMDGTFQANEQFVTTSSYAASPITGSISLPATATSGPTRMRVLAAFTPSNPTNPCTNAGTGEYNDYSITIDPPPSCMPVTGMIVNSTQLTSASVSWTASTSNPAIGYYWVVVPQGQGSGATPVASGLEIPTNTTANPLGLTSATNYTLYVRAVCSSSDSSFWTSINFTTAYPVPPNDDCINAIDISNGQVVNGYVNSATQSQAACDATVLANDVWYKFTTGPNATTVTINANTSATGTDLVMEAFSGSCGTLTTMIPTASSGSGTGCIDGPAAGLETGTYTVTPNTTYYVRVYGYNTFQGTFPIQLITPPVNDDICSAITLIIDDVNPSCVNTQGATVGANDPANACSSNNNTVWYQFTPTVSQPYYLIASVPANSIDPLGAWLFTYTATGACPSLTLTPAGGIGVSCQSSAYPASPGSITSFTTATLTANTTYYLFVDGNSSDIGDICFQVLSFPLSIKLTEITAVNVGNRNRVNWVSENEDNGDYYELERSADGKDFMKMAKINGKGAAASYTYWDEKPLSGTNYYRLKMIDAAGHTSYSKTVLATNRATADFSVQAYPNPVSNGKLTVVAYGTNDKDAMVTITDLTGKVIKAQNMANGLAEIDMIGLAQGMYLVKYTDAHHSEIIKVNKR